MRRMIERLCQEARGGVSVMVALLLVVLLGAAAITVDAGVMYAERAELQNGADAAALAIAQDCADGSCLSTSATAELYANRNAKDDATNVTDIQLAPSSVTVDVASRDGATGDDSLSLFFAPVMGIDVTTVGATATAGWSTYPASGPALLPLAVSWCVYDSTVGPQLIQVHGDDTPECVSSSPSGQVIPGGFGWLTDEGGCTAQVDIDVEAQMDGDTGNNVTNACKDVLADNVGKVILLPIFEEVTGNGDPGTYTIKGWGGFKLMGWRFPGTSHTPSEAYSAPSCTNSCFGLIGEFVDYGSLGDGFTGTTDPDADLGASIVTLTK